MGILLKISEAAVKLGGLLGREFKAAVFFPDLFSNDVLFVGRQLVNLFEDLRRTHGGNLLLWFFRASRSFTGENFVIHGSFPMTLLTELLASVRRVKVRTNRLVNAAADGARLGEPQPSRLAAIWEYAQHPRFNPLDFERFGNYGEFAIIKNPADKPRFDSNSLEFDGIRNSGMRRITQLKP